MNGQTLMAICYTSIFRTGVKKTYNVHQKINYRDYVRCRLIDNSIVQRLERQLERADVAEKGFLYKTINELKNGKTQKRKA